MTTIDLDGSDKLDTLPGILKRMIHFFASFIMSHAHSNQRLLVVEDYFIVQVHNLVYLTNIMLSNK